MAHNNSRHILHVDTRGTTKMKKITLPWADKFRQIIKEENIKSPEIITKFMKYIEQRETEITELFTGDEAVEQTYYSRVTKNEE